MYVHTYFVPEWRTKQEKVIKKPKGNKKKIALYIHDCAYGVRCTDIMLHDISLKRFYLRYLPVADQVDNIAAAEKVVRTPHE